MPFHDDYALAKPMVYFLGRVIAYLVIVALVLFLVL